MPYVEQEDRKEIDLLVAELLEEIDTVGKANYAMTKIAQGMAGQLHDYTSLNETIGLFECAKLEFYRRWVVPYEEKKRKENGDVF